MLARLAYWLERSNRGPDTINLRGWEKDVFNQLVSTKETC